LGFELTGFDACCFVCGIGVITWRGTGREWGDCVCVCV